MIRHNFNPHSRSAPEPENFDSELNGPIKQKEDKPNKKASLLEIANNSISSGLGQFNQSLASTLDFLLPTEFLGKYDFVSKINDYYSNQADRFSNKLQESVSDRGKPIQIGAKALEATTSAAPNALLAVMSGGTSAAAQGTTAALSTASAAAGRSAVANAVRQTAANPLYWSSVAQTLGNNYEHAKAKGANELQATGSAITSSLLNAAVETGGGVETLPGILKSRARGSASAWAKSALTEGLEEPIQGVVSGASEALFFDRDKPVASLPDRNAIFSPSRMAEEFATGAAVGGILGAGQLAGRRLFTPDPMEPARRGDYSGLMQELETARQTKRLNEFLREYKKQTDSLSAPLQEKIESEGKDDIITSFQIGKSVGASAKNYPVKMPDSKQRVKFAEGQIVEGIAFAGKGTNTEIRDRFRLEATYKIPTREWQKMSGNACVVIDGKETKAEIHWYSAKGKNVEMKIKRYLDED